MESTINGRETYSTAVVDAIVTSGSSHPTEPVPIPQPIAEVREEEDDPSIPVPVGAKCKRHGCEVKFESEETNRRGEGEGTVCIHHPAPVSQ